MSESNKSPHRPRVPKSKQTVQTRSGKTLRVNQSLGGRMKARKDEKARTKAAYLATLPKERWKRVLYRLHPKRVAKYWFSKQGAIMALKILGVSIVVLFILMIAVFAYFRKDLPKLEDINSSKIGGSITYYDRTGTTVLFQDYESVKRVPVQYDQMSDYLREATISIEDKNFYSHGAFDVSGIVRAGINDVFGSGGRQGGSTITQQLVKMDQNWGGDVTYARKIKELILAVDVEREYSKDDIITGYLNLAPYGPVQNGVETASQDYFGIPAKDISLAQAAFLAAIPKSPSYYSPYSGLFEKEELLARKNYILDRMTETKDREGKFYITKKEAEEAKKIDILAQVRPRPTNKYEGIRAPYFVLAAREQLVQQRGAAAVNRGGWKVITTVDMHLQNFAEQKVADNFRNIQRYGADQQAFVAADVETGQIMALVGGVDFNNEEYGKINYATEVNVSPGSSFKPYDYAAFIDGNSAGAGSVLYDNQGALPGYPCTNKVRPTKTNVTSSNPPNCLWDYDFRYPGAVSLRYAAGGSRNVPAVKAMLSAVPNDTSVGRINSINKTISIAEGLMGNEDGYRCYETGTEIFGAQKSDETQCYSSSAIGDGAYLHLDDHVNGLASLSRLGSSIPKTYILKITDPNNKAIYEWKQPEGKQVLKADSAYIVNDMLADPNASYLNAASKFHNYNGWKFAIKTGTTNDNFDGLMGSWSSKYAVITWVGDHTRNKALSGGAMETMTLPVVRAWMQEAHNKLNTTAVNWKQPSGVKQAPAYVVRTHIGLGSREPSPSNDLYPSWYTPKTTGGSSGTQTIDKVSNKNATNCTPELAKVQQGGGNDNVFSADVFVNSRTAISSAGGDDDIHKCDDAKPTIASMQVVGSCKVNMECKVNVTPLQGTHALVNPAYAGLGGGVVKLTVNGADVAVTPITDSGVVMSFTFTPTAAGDLPVRATIIDSVLYSNESSGTITVGT
ncbi:MAG: transglycosylase domain-containing protein [Candidatus Saccharimonadales bacterium]